MKHDHKTRIGSFRIARFALLTMVFVFGIASIVATTLVKENIWCQSNNTGFKFQISQVIFTLPLNI